MKRREGFTLIEILAAVTILGIISVVAVVSVNKVIQNAKDQHYVTAEDQLEMAGQSYVQQNRGVLPKTIGQKSKIPLKTLVEKNYIKPIKDYSDNNCDMEKSYVQVFKYSQKDYSYIAYLECPTYTSKETIEKGSPLIDIEVSDPGKTKAANAKVTITSQEKLLSWSYIIYKDGEEVKNSGSIQLSKYDKNISKTISLGKYTPGKVKIVVTATNIYGLTTKKTSDTVEFKDTQGPTCIIKDVDSKDNPKNWTKGPITITVGCDDGDGVGCKRAEFSTTFKKTTDVGIVVIEDKSGNKTECEVSVNIDVTPPTVPSIGLYKWTNNSTRPTDTTGLSTYTANTWSAQNVFTKGINSSDGEGIGIEKYQYVITGDAPNVSDVDGQTASIETTGTSTIKYRACDKLGNCSAYSAAQTIKVDKVAPSCVSSGGSTVWTNKDMTLTGKCSDSHSGCKSDVSLKYTKDINSTTEGPGSVSDNVGNTTVCPNNQTVKIDKTPPTIPTGGAIGTVSGSTAATSIKTAASGSTDALSGVKEYLYVVKTTAGTPANTDSGFKASLSYTRACGQTNYAYAIAVDNAGNRSPVKGLGTSSDAANSYSNWSACSKACGSGTQTRTNSCALVTTGFSQSCNTQDCCSSTDITSYGAWSGCDASCGSGHKTRTVYRKSKYNGQTCPSTTETTTCDAGPCGPPSHTCSVTVLGTSLHGCGYKLSCGTTHTQAYYGYCGICWNYGIKVRPGAKYYCPGNHMDGCKNAGRLHPNVVPD